MDELTLASAFGAAFDNPGATITCLVGDAAAESGATAAAWPSIRFLDSERDGAVAVVLAITDDTVFAGMSDEELGQLFAGLGWRARFEGEPGPGEVLVARGAATTEPTDYGAEPSKLTLPDPASFDSLDAYLAGVPEVRVIAPGLRDESVLQGWMRGYVHSGRHAVYVSDRVTRVLTAGTYVLRELPPLPDGLDTRVYLPPDTPTLLAVLDRCLDSPGLVNIVVAPDDAAPARLDAAAAKDHVARGASVWEWAGMGEGEPDIVLAACGPAATVELLGAAELLREEVPELRVRFVNVVDLFALASSAAHPTGLSQSQFGAVFTKDRPVLFTVQGPPAVVRQLIHRRPQQTRFHVTPLANRYALAIEALNRADLLAAEMLPGMSGEFAVRAVPDAEAAINKFRAALD